MKRSIPTAVVSVISLVAPVAAPFVLAVRSAHAASAGRLVTGATYNMKWGAVTVKLRLDSKNKRIINVFSVLPTERPRSANINGHAGPILKREVLAAQSANIRLVSGATMTSRAYKLSLQNAVRKAHL